MKAKHKKITISLAEPMIELVVGLETEKDLKMTEREMISRVVTSAYENGLIRINISDCDKPKSIVKNVGGTH